MESKNFIQDYFLGIQYGDFDDRIKASSEFSNNYSVKGCKLNKTMENGHSSSWCAASSDKNALIEYKFRRKLFNYWGVYSRKR